MSLQKFQLPGNSNVTLGPCPVGQEELGEAGKGDFLSLKELFPQGGSPCPAEAARRHLGMFLMSILVIPQPLKIIYKVKSDIQSPLLGPKFH